MLMIMIPQIRNVEEELADAENRQRTLQESEVKLKCEEDRLGRFLKYSDSRARKLSSSRSVLRRRLFSAHKRVLLDSTEDPADREVDKLV